VAAELFHADGQTESRDEAKSRLSQIFEDAKYTFNISEILSERQQSR
jgi:hypothetical protein